MIGLLHGLQTPTPEAERRQNVVRVPDTLLSFYCECMQGFNYSLKYYVCTARGTVHVHAHVCVYCVAQGWILG